MNIEYLRSTASNNLELGKLKQSAEKTGKPAGGSEIKGASDDKLSISSQARSLHNTDMRVRERLSELPEVRQERIAAVKERLQSGYYLSEEGTEDSAEAFVAGFSKASRRDEESTLKVLLNKLDEEPEIRKADVDRASERNAAGYYNQEEPMKQTADRLWIPPLYRK